MARTMQTCRERPRRREQAERRKREDILHNHFHQAHRIECGNAASSASDISPIKEGGLPAPSDSTRANLDLLLKVDDLAATAKAMGMEMSKQDILVELHKRRAIAQETCPALAATALNQVPLPTLEQIIAASTTNPGLESASNLPTVTDRDASLQTLAELEARVDEQAMDEMAMLLEEEAVNMEEDHAERYGIEGACASEDGDYGCMREDGSDEAQDQYEKEADQDELNVVPETPVKPITQLSETQESPLVDLDREDASPMLALSQWRNSHDIFLPTQDYYHGGGVASGTGGVTIEELSPTHGVAGAAKSNSQNHGLVFASDDELLECLEDAENRFARKKAFSGAARFPRSSGTASGASAATPVNSVPTFQAPTTTASVARHLVDPLATSHAALPHAGLACHPGVMAPHFAVHGHAFQYAAITGGMQSAVAQAPSLPAATSVAFPVLGDVTNLAAHSISYPACNAPSGETALQLQALMAMHDLCKTVLSRR